MKKLHRGPSCVRALASIQAFGNLRNRGNAGLRYGNLNDRPGRARWNNASRESD